MGSRRRRARRPRRLRSALETPRGVLVDTLLEQRLSRLCAQSEAAGSVSGPVHRRRARKTTAATRTSWPTRLRTDRRAFRRVRADDPAIIQLRELCHAWSTDLQVEEGRLANRLREQLYRVHAAVADPQPRGRRALALDCSSVTRRIRSRGRSCRAERITRRACGRIGFAGSPPTTFSTALRQPRLTVAAGRGGRRGDPDRGGDAADDPRAPAAARQPNARSIASWSSSATAEPADGEPREHRDVEILRSLPGVGRMVTATMLTEAAGPLADRDYATLAYVYRCCPRDQTEWQTGLRRPHALRVQTALAPGALPLVAHEHPARSRRARLLRCVACARPRSCAGAPECRRSVAPHSRRHAQNHARCTTPHDSRRRRYQVDNGWGVSRRDRLAPSLLNPPLRTPASRWPSVACAGLRHATLQDTSGASADGRRTARLVLRSPRTLEAERSAQHKKRAGGVRVGDVVAHSSKDKRVPRVSGRSAFFPRRIGGAATQHQRAGQS